MTKNNKHKSPADALRERVTKLKLHGLLAHWEDYHDAPWLPEYLSREEAERDRRSLERRLRNAKIGKFKPISDFDWSWPSRIDREMVEDLFTLDFLSEQANVILVGPNGVGKTTIAQNLTYHAVLRGYSAYFSTASKLLNDLAAQDGPSSLARRLSYLEKPGLITIDEVGYLSYDSRHADLLFEIVSRRSNRKSIIVTTNRPFAEWSEVFPSSTSVVALVDRLVHLSEVVQIEGESYRLKEAKEREAKKAKKRAAKRKGRK